MTFIKWLIIQRNSGDSIIDDIAEDVRKDIKDGWNGSTYSGLIRRIKMLKGSDLAIEAAERAYNKYKEKNR